ncbi:MAG: hypothetical protein CMJ47_13340 [Planctomyces sp.]|nr:hypothetical protein [Planctomyces sp.]
MGFLCNITEPQAVVTAIDTGIRFPEIVDVLRRKYERDILLFSNLVRQSNSSGELLEKIRSPMHSAKVRMSLLKIFRRAVSGVCDTEKTKKISAVTTQSLIDAFGHTFKPISKLREQFGELDDATIAALAVSIGEYDNRGKQGYVLTGMFFDWFQDRYSDVMQINGPRGAGPDIELSNVIPEFTGFCPCDFVIRSIDSHKVVAVGFARYDSTRGGAQSDDRTGGNMHKVLKIKEFCQEHDRLIKIIFISDGPGLTHNDTWREACSLDGVWEDNVRVSTLKLCDDRIHRDWLLGSESITAG